MRPIARFCLVVFAFTIPWEYSLDLGEPLGNVARIAGLLALLTAIPAVLQAGRVRRPGATQWVVLALYVWFCLSCLWTIDGEATLEKIRSYFQGMMVVWLVWEFADSGKDLRALLRAWVAGSWVLAILTVANFASPAAYAAGQIRFTAAGQDPNDVARFLDLGLPLAALLFGSERRWPIRLVAAGYLPVGLFAVLLTASRGGFMGAIAAVAGSGLLVARGQGKRLLAGALALPAIVGLLWVMVPEEIFQRLATISEQVKTGDLNQRAEIWASGWHAFTSAPLFGYGAGTFASAVGLSPEDTAHNTILAILVDGGLCGLFLAAAVLGLAAHAIARARGALRLALGTTLLVWVITAQAAAVEENRSTWLLFGLIALAGRLAGDTEEGREASLPADPAPRSMAVAHEASL